jgi:renalase
MEHNLRRVAVVGAGMAGLACAGALHGAGLEVAVFDKGRRAGGRLASRRVDCVAFNHGAPWADARGPEFEAVLDGMTRAGTIAPWPAAGPGRWAGVPGMSALARYMEAQGAGTMHVMRHVAHLDRERQGWMVRHLDAATARPGLVTREGGECAGPFDAVLLALPAPQAAALLRGVPHPFADKAGRASMAPCWTLMLAFAEPGGGASLLLPGGALAWAARDSSRPGREATPECWVAHASADWSRTHLEDDAATVQAVLQREFAAATGITQAPAYAAVHRWRYALADAPLGVPALWDADAGLGVCGDWCFGARVEDAFTSGRALAAMVLP